MTCGECLHASKTGDPDLRRCENKKSPYFGCTMEPNSKACEKIVRHKCQ